MHPLFTLKEALLFGWKKTIKNFWFLSLLTLCSFILSFAFDSVRDGGVTVLMFRIINFLFSYFVMFTFVKVGLSIYRGKKPVVKDIFHVSWPVFGWYILGTLISGIIVGLGFILLIIPGVYLSVRFSFFGFALIDEKLKLVDAFKRSMELTQGHFWQLFGFSLTLGLINALGIILFGVGLLITVPLSLVATAYVYEKLKTASTKASA